MIPRMSAAKHLIVGNWKMHPPSLADAKKIFRALLRGMGTYRHATLAVCPPAAYLAELRTLYRGRRLMFGAQSCHFLREGAYTGEIAPPMLASLGVRLVIVGHSERRAMGEDNALVRKKLKAVLDEGMEAVLCIGEAHRDGSGEYVAFLTEQLKSALSGLTVEELARVCVAYEPLWAIGKSAADSAVRPAHVHEMVIFVRKFVHQRYGREVAARMRVLYGGSVEPANAAALLLEGRASGLLVGHASIVPKDFLAIAALADQPAL